MASPIESGKQLYAVMSEKSDSSTLVVVLQTMSKEVLRMEQALEDFTPESRNYRYLEKKYEQIKKEKALEDQFNADLAVAFKRVVGFDRVFLIADTSLNTLFTEGRCRSCKMLSEEAHQKDFPIGEEYIVFRRSNHPLTNTLGYYFYNSQRAYLDDPFVDYIPYRSFWDKLSALFGASNEARLNPEELVDRINEKLEKKWYSRNAELVRLYSKS